MPLETFVEQEVTKISTPIEDDADSPDDFQIEKEKEEIILGANEGISTTPEIETESGPAPQGVRSRCQRIVWDVDDGPTPVLHDTRSWLCRATLVVLGWWLSS